MKKTSLIIASLVVSAIPSGCGGSSGPAPLQIQLSPAAPTLAINSSILITADTMPALTAHLSTTTWSVVGYSTKCTEGVVGASTAPPIPDCPNGWLAWEITPPEFPPEAAYYYSPAAPGSYQISVQAQIMSNNSQQVTYQGSTNATVTVTAQ